MDNVQISIPKVHLSDLEKLVSKVKQATSSENAEIGFDFIIASLFPTSWENIKADLSRHYTKGYIQGRADEREETRQRFLSDFDCYCE